jgi:hypothetical protein
MEMRIVFVHFVIMVVILCGKYFFSWLYLVLNGASLASKLH